MSFHVNWQEKLPLLRCEELQAPHAFTTRLGGVSQGVWESLNLGLSRGDDREAVLENRRRVAAAVGFSTEKLVCTRQIHTDTVRIVTEADWGLGMDIQPNGCDGLVTNVPGTALMVFSADCTMILLEDPVTGAVGAVHAGWRGTALGIVKTAVETMTAAFGSRAGDLRAAIGPCIDRCCFETKSDVPEAMLSALGDEARGAIDDHGDGTYHVDLKALNSIWLRQVGVEQIAISDLCTACNTDRFWSHRRVGDARGVQAAVIVCPHREEPR